MKYLFLIVSLIVLSELKILAQQRPFGELLKSRMNREEPGLPAKEAINHLNSDVYIVDTIYKYKIFSKSLMYLYVGGNYSNPALTIIVKGTDKELKMKRKDWSAGVIHVTGKAILYTGKPAIIVTSGYQFGVQIQI